MEIKNRENLTWLPHKIIEVSDSIFPLIIIETPHRGQLKWQFTNDVNMYFSGTVGNGNLQHFTEWIAKIEDASRQYLVNQWIKNDPPLGKKIN